MRCLFSLQIGLTAALFALMLSPLFALVAGEPAEPPVAEPPAADPPPAAPQADELPVGEDVKPSEYKSLPKPFQSKKIGEAKPMMVWYDAKVRRVFIEGRFCLADGGIEFLAVADGGKVHESLLEMSCRPQDLLYALLVCTYECNNNLSSEGESVVPAGDPLHIYVEYKKDNKTVRQRIEHFAFNRYTQKQMKEISFAFTGSSYSKDPQTGKSVFNADMEKDLVTCFRTAWSVFNTPLLLGNNDSVYQVYKDRVPPKGTECVLVFTRGKPIDKNEIDDTEGKEIKADGQEGKEAQMAGHEGERKPVDDFTPVDPMKEKSPLATP